MLLIVKWLTLLCILTFIHVVEMGDLLNFCSGEKRFYFKS